MADSQQALSLPCPPCTARTQLICRLHVSRGMTATLCGQSAPSKTPHNLNCVVLRRLRKGWRRHTALLKWALQHGLWGMRVLSNYCLGIEIIISVVEEAVRWLLLCFFLHCVPGLDFVQPKKCVNTTFLDHGCVLTILLLAISDVSVQLSDAFSL
jgi:hypothetical protein